MTESSNFNINLAFIHAGDWELNTTGRILKTTEHMYEQRSRQIIHLVNKSSPCQSGNVEIFLILVHV